MLSALAAVTMLTGCSYVLTVETRPAGALVTLPDGGTMTAPASWQSRYAPFRSEELRVAAPGYRPLVVDIPSRLSDREIELVLVPEHGPAGTWTPEGEELE